MYAGGMARLVSGMLPQTSARSSAAMRKNLLNASALRRIVLEIVEKHLEDRAREAGKEQRGNQPASTGQNDVIERNHHKLAIQPDHLGSGRAQLFTTEGD